jgi:hypothetical protein
LVRDLDPQLDGTFAPASCLLRDRTRTSALAGMIAREWGNAAFAGALGEMLARDGGSNLPLEGSG